ncbi:MAG TPA: hypothetical protein VI432_00750 [Candidatus Paceibacterota bacterium]
MIEESIRMKGLRKTTRSIREILTERGCANSHLNDDQLAELIRSMLNGNGEPIKLRSTEGHKEFMEQLRRFWEYRERTIMDEKLTNAFGSAHH